MIGKNVQGGRICPFRLPPWRRSCTKTCFQVSLPSFFDSYTTTSVVQSMSFSIRFSQRRVIFVSRIVVGLEAKKKKNKHTLICIAASSAFGLAALQTVVFSGYTVRPAVGVGDKSPSPSRAI